VEWCVGFGGGGVLWEGGGGGCWGCWKLVGRRATHCRWVRRCTRPWVERGTESNFQMVEKGGGGVELKRWDISVARGANKGVGVRHWKGIKIKQWPES